MIVHDVKLLVSYYSVKLSSLERLTGFRCNIYGVVESGCTTSTTLNVKVRRETSAYGRRV
jgi:hypothetical protein